MGKKQISEDTKRTIMIMYRDKASINQISKSVDLSPLLIDRVIQEKRADKIPDKTPEGRPMKSILHDFEYYGRCNDSDFPQVIDALRYFINNPSFNKEREVENVEVEVVPAPVVIEQPEEKAQRLVSTIISINATLDTIKPLYGELDQAVLELRELVGLNKFVIEPGTQIAVQIVDEYAEKNTIWRIQSSQRFVAKIKTLEDRIKQAEKEAKAAEKAAKALAK
jgi:hypothetical protein